MAIRSKKLHLLVTIQVGWQLTSPETNAELVEAVARACPDQNSGTPKHTDHLAFGLDPRERNSKLHKKDRANTAYDRVGENVGRFGNTIKKIFQGDERGDHDPRDSRESRYHRDLRDQRSDMSSEPRYSRNDEDRLRDEKNAWKDRSEKLERIVLQHQEENIRLRAKLDEERARVEQAVRSADHMQSAIDNREYFLGEQSSDDDICTMFLVLLNEIKNWSLPFSKSNPGTLREEKFRDFQKITPMYAVLCDLEDTITNGKQKRFFVRGWTGYVMCTRLFRSLEGPERGLAPDVWLAKPIADHFRFLEDRLYLAGQYCPHVTVGATDDFRSAYCTNQILQRLEGLHGGASRKDSRNSRWDAD